MQVELSGFHNLREYNDIRTYESAVPQKLNDLSLANQAMPELEATSVPADHSLNG